ncbi:RTA1 domain-containing protein [Sporosarcina sp. ANT_H38]|uniref:RTA1 domain-containing protein n=1 Tax=Sporosarcina sp. ANT_H38 TaxID=2597358 RepID=UPI0011F184C7|nr:RTA1 domain-containing protein [Sporosarcina sp. ANT_H38]KAA0955741.1 RTA1 domain-containing protein [Sporosarcina sp. ANT_H38]
MSGLLSLIFIALIIWYFLQGRKKPNRQINKKWTYMFLAIYAAVLIIATIAAELIDTTSLNSQPKAESNEHLNRLTTAIQNGDIGSIDSSNILSKRTQKIGKTLQMNAQGIDIHSTIIVERKNENDGLIEETLIKPLLLVGDYDFSDQLKYKIPEWTADSVTFLEPPLTEIIYTTYQEAYLLNQFTDTSWQKNNSYNTSERQVAVHLLVPKDLIITADENLYINYINE